MSICKTKINEGVKIKINDSLTKYEVSKYCEKMDSFLTDPCSVILNLQDVTECDTAGLQLLFSLKKSVELNQNSFQIELISSAITQTAERLGINLDLLNISNS